VMSAIEGRTDKRPRGTRIAGFFFFLRVSWQYSIKVISGEEKIRTAYKNGQIHESTEERADQRTPESINNVMRIRLILAKFFLLSITKIRV